MTIASLSHSASRFGSPSLSVVFAPVQALMALFVPLQRSPAICRPATPCPGQRLPVGRDTSRLNTTISSTNKRALALAGTAGSTRPVSRLKIVREFEPGMARSQAGRMVISGRMSDVCAELDRIAQIETSRHTGHQLVIKSAQAES